MNLRASVVGDGRLVCLALVSAACAAACAPAPSEPASAIGDPVAVDLTGTDPAVAGLLSGLLERARGAPDDAERRGELGLGYDANGFLAGAEQCYEEAAILAPAEPRWPYLLGIVRARRGAVEDGLASIERAIAAEPGYAPAHIHAGQWLLDLGKPAEAEAAFRRALALAPALWAPRIGLARALLQLGRPGEVPALLERASSVPGGLDPTAAQLLLQAYRDTGRVDRARALAAQARPAGPTASGWPDPWSDAKVRFLAGFGAAMMRGETLLSSGRTAEALDVLEALRRERPGDVQLLNNLAIAYRRSGRDEQALEVLLAGIRGHPGFFPFHMNLGNLYETRGDYERALEHFERACELNPALAIAHRRRGILLLRAGRVEQALEAWEAAVERGDRDPSLLLQGSRIAAGLGRCERAVAWFDSAVRLDPAASGARGWLGGCADVEGRPAE